MTSFSTQTRSSLTASGSLFVENITDDNEKNDGLSNGAIAGISVTAAVVTFTIIVLVVWIVISRRRNSAEVKVSNNLNIQPHGTASNGDSNLHRLRELDDSRIIRELSHTNRFELDPASASVELFAVSPEALTVQLPNSE